MDIVTIIILVFIVLLGLVYAIRSKLKALLVVFLKIAFPLFFALALISLFLPSIFDASADILLKANGTFDRIVEFDDSFSAPSDIINDFFDVLRGDSEDSTESGLLEEQLYPMLVSTTAGVLRILVLMGSIVGMVLSIYFSYSFEGLIQSSKLEIELSKLRREIELLKQKSAS